MQLITKFWKTKLVMIASSVVLTAVIWSAFAWPDVSAARTASTKKHQDDYAASLRFLAAVSAPPPAPPAPPAPPPEPPTIIRQVVVVTKYVNADGQPAAEGDLSAAAAPAAAAAGAGAPPQPAPSQPAPSAPPVSAPPPRSVSAPPPRASAPPPAAAPPAPRPAPAPAPRPAPAPAPAPSTGS